MIQRARIAGGRHDELSPVSASVPLQLVRGLDGRLRPFETVDAAPPSLLPITPPTEEDDEAYTALVAANRARLAELRSQRYGVPDFRDHLSGGHGVALLAVLATVVVGRIAFALTLPHLYRPGSLAAVPLVLGLLVERVGQYRRRR